MSRHLLLRLSDRLFGGNPRLDGAQATEWERGYFTKDRADLPPSPTRETAWQRLLRKRGFRLR